MQDHAGCLWNGSDLFGKCFVGCFDETGFMLTFLWVALPKFNMVHLKMAPWNRRFLLIRNHHNFRFDVYVKLGECIVYKKNPTWGQKGSAPNH